MAKYKHLGEEVVIDIENNSLSDNNKISIILRNVKNENTKISFDKSKTILIKDLKSEVNIN